MNEIFIGYIGAALFLISPLVLGKIIFKKLFTKEAVFRFYNGHFSCQSILLNNKTKENIFYYNQIKYAKITNSLSSRNSLLRLTMENGKNIEYHFQEEISDKKESVSLAECVYGIIYNEKVKQGQQLLLLPSLYASKPGKYLFLILTIAFVIACILHMIYSIKTIHFTFLLALILYAQIYVKRKRDIAFYKYLRDKKWSA